MLNLRSLFRRNRNISPGGRRSDGALSPAGAQIVGTRINSYSPWGGSVFDDDISRTAIWSFAEIVSKTEFIHIRGKGEGMKHNPDPEIRLLLEQPNEYLTMQDIIAKLAVQYDMYNNAFCYVARNPATKKPSLLYPLDYSSVKLEQDSAHRLYCRFLLRDKEFIVPYSDIIHLRRHFGRDEFFGDGNAKPLANLMELLTTADQGAVKAIKNSAIINWILHFKQVLQPDDVKAHINTFASSYLSAEANQTTVLPDDPRYDAEQIKHESYVPNAEQTEKARARAYSYWETSDAIVTSKFTEDEYNAYYEKRCEPFIRQLATQMTLTFFSPADRARNNRIMPNASSLGYASLKTKLGLVDMVDRGAMLNNEWRDTFNMPPIPGGDVPIRRLDTAAIDGNSQPVANPNTGKETETMKDKPESLPESQTEEQPGERAAKEAAHRDWLFEVRAIQEEGGSAFVAEGDAIVFDTPALMYEDPEGHKYYEVICKGALDGADMSDVPMRYNHSKSFMIVGRHNEKRPNRSTVDFEISDAALHIRADLSKTESARQLHEAIKAELVTQMSFAFTVSEESYDPETRTRKIYKIKKLWDIAAVDTPAYDTTSIYARNRFTAEAEAAKRIADAADARKKAALADLDILLALTTD